MSTFKGLYFDGLEEMMMMFTFDVVKFNSGNNFYEQIQIEVGKEIKTMIITKQCILFEGKQYSYYHMSCRDDEHIISAVERINIIKRIFRACLPCVSKKTFFVVTNRT